MIICTKSCGIRTNKYLQLKNFCLFGQLQNAFVWHSKSSIPKYKSNSQLNTANSNKQLKIDGQRNQNNSLLLRSTWLLPLESLLGCLVDSVGEILLMVQALLLTSGFHLHGQGEILTSENNTIFTSESNNKRKICTIRTLVLAWSTVDFLAPRPRISPFLFTASVTAFLLSVSSSSSSSSSFGSYVIAHISKQSHP